jgi:hypothetical protein
VRLGTIIANVLADLHAAELFNHPWSEQKADEERRQARIYRPKRDVAEDVKYRKYRM